MKFSFMTNSFLTTKLAVVFMPLVFSSWSLAETQPSDFKPDDISQIRDFSSETLDDILVNLSLSDLPELDEHEAYIDEDPESELAVISDMLRNLGGIMISSYLSGDKNSLEGSQQFPNDSLRMLRDAHPQGLVCFEGRLKVYPNDLFESGLFSKAKNYDVVSRFSSSSPSLNDDATRDLRGLALKFISENAEHDFVGISSPIFPTDDAKQFSDLVKLVRLTDCMDDPSGIFSCITETGFPNPWRLLFSALKLIRLTTNSVDNGLLEKQYFSVSPYKFESADQKVYFKFHIDPKNCDNADTSYALNKTDERNYLGDNVRNIIAQNDICFALKATAITGDVESRFLEKHSQTWLDMGAEVSEVTLGEVRFSKETPELSALACDNLSFSPANTSYGFSALGSINRARAIIYKSLSKLRHETNAKIKSTMK